MEDDIKVEIIDPIEEMKAKLEALKGDREKLTAKLEQIKKVTEQTYAELNYNKGSIDTLTALIK